MEGMDLVGVVPTGVALERIVLETLEEAAAADPTALPVQPPSLPAPPIDVPTVPQVPLPPPPLPLP
jgi:hypothetical protein